LVVFAPPIQSTPPSVRAATDNGGNVHATYGYDAYGERRCTWSYSSGDCNDVSAQFGYAGEYTDDESGLQYLRARYYDPVTQQFISRDPLQIKTKQPYAYGYGNPINVADPTGMEGMGWIDEPLPSAGVNWNMEGGLPGASYVGPKPASLYKGVQQASAYMREMGIPRERRVEMINTFVIQTIRVRRAGDNEFAIRYFDNEVAFPKGRFLFETFPASRDSLAILPMWNAMKSFRQWQIRPGTIVIEGRAGPQGSYKGGQVQKLVLNPREDLLP
jgi:RHS repeat-associated protein